MDQDERFMMFLGGVRDEAGTRSYLERNLAHWAEHGFGLWMLRSRDSGRMTGRAVLRHLMIDGVDEVETGYGFLPQFWGLGLATETAQACLEIGRDELHLSSLVGITASGNTASQQVLRKAGFEFERGILHDGLHCMLFRSSYSRQSGSNPPNGHPWNDSGE